MARYFYDKYEKIPVHTYAEGDWVSLTAGMAAFIKGYERYYFNKNTGHFSIGGDEWLEGADEGYTTLYQFRPLEPNNIRKIQFEGPPVMDDRPYIIHVKTSYIASTRYIRGAYIETIKGDDKILPDNGYYGDYWYVKRDRAFPALKIKLSNALKTSGDGWARVSGQLRQIQQIWVRVNGQLKEV